MTGRGDKVARGAGGGEVTDNERHVFHSEVLLELAAQARKDAASDWMCRDDLFARAATYEAGAAALREVDGLRAERDAALRDAAIQRKKADVLSRQPVCPDHRDKFHMRGCPACLLETAEAERDAMRTVLVRISGGYSVPGTNVKDTQHPSVGEASGALLAIRGSADGDFSVQCPNAEMSALVDRLGSTTGRVERAYAEALEQWARWETETKTLSAERGALRVLVQDYSRAVVESWNFNDKLTASPTDVRRIAAERDALKAQVSSEDRPTMEECASVIASFRLAPPMDLDALDKCEAEMLDLCRRLGAKQ